MTTINEFTKIKFWKKLNPELSITPSPFKQQPSDVEISGEAAKQCLQQVIDEGHFCTDALIPYDEVKLLADAIQKIVDIGLPPAFIYVYDEAWQIFRRLSQIVEPILDEDYKITIAGMWAWYIDKDGEGFTIHRDMFSKSFLEDGRPEHLTVWIPLTDVTTLNSCMHVLPTNLDPNFPDNLHKLEITNVNHIRALPAKAGSIIAWNANTGHWGTKASKWATNPRISIAMDFSRADIHEGTEELSYAGGPELNSYAKKDFTYEMRLKAIGEAITFYKTRIPDIYPETAETPV